MGHPQNQKISPCAGVRLIRKLNSRINLSELGLGVIFPAKLEVGYSVVTFKVKQVLALLNILSLNFFPTDEITDW